MALGLNMSEVKMEIACLHGEDTPTVEVSVHTAGQDTKKRTSVLILGGPSPTHPAFPWRSHHECSKRGAATIDTYASFTIDRPLTSDSRYGCLQAKQLQPRLRMHDMEPARNPLPLRPAHRALLHRCIWWHIYNCTDYVLSYRGTRAATAECEETAEATVRK